MIDWSTFGILVGAPVFRSIAGWLENSWEDGKIEKFELVELGKTVFRVGILSVAVWLGLDKAGTGNADIIAASSVIAFEYVVSSIKKKRADNATKKK